MKKILIAVGVAVVAVGVWALFMREPVDEVVVQVSDTPMATGTVTASPTESPVTSSIVAVKTFAITGSPFSFSLKEIKVNKGDTVKIVFTNAEGMHDWVIDQFDARTPIIQAGKTAEVTFVADTAGTFEYYCSVGNHRAMGMKGNLIVQ